MGKKQKTRKVEAPDSGGLVYSTHAATMASLLAEALARHEDAAEPGTEAKTHNKAVKLRLEKQGRAGKMVTVLYDLNLGLETAEALCRRLQKHCGCGGASTDTEIMLQGDMREKVRQYLTKEGYRVKGG
jgi:translation initiation factor 1